MPRKKADGTSYRYPEKDKEYREKNKDRIKARQTKWIEENRQRVNEQALARYHANREHKCELAKKYYSERVERDPVGIMWQKIKNRAEAKGIEFNIEPNHIIIPEICPVLHIPLFRNIGGKGPQTNSPTLDRIDPTKGYVKGNVVVISYRANRIKNDASWQELLKISNWLRKQENPKNV